MEVKTTLFLIFATAVYIIREIIVAILEEKGANNSKDSIWKELYRYIRNLKGQKDD